MVGQYCAQAPVTGYLYNSKYSVASRCVHKQKTSDLAMVLEKKKAITRGEGGGGEGGCSNCYERYGIVKKYIYNKLIVKSFQKVA